MTTATKAKQNGSKAASFAQQKPSTAIAIKPKELTIDERLEKIKGLTNLGDHRALLIEKKQKVNHFLVHCEEEPMTLTIQTEPGDAFFTNNPVVIKGQLQSLERTITDKIDEIEMEILAFSV